MKIHFNFLFAGAAAVAFLVSGCASRPAPVLVVLNPPPAAPVAAPAAVPTVAPAVSPLALKVIKVDSEETAGEDGRGANAVDGDPNTIWHTQWQDANPEHPHEIVIELSSPATIKGFTYLPRNGDSENGMIKGYEFYVSNDGQDFGQSVARGEFDNGKDLKTVSFSPQACRFIKLKALSEINGEAWTSAAEIGVVLQ